MDEMQEIIQDYIVETTELIETLDNDLIALEKCESEDEKKELLNSIFRAVHTIKGASGFLGFGQLVDVCHLTETLFNKLRHGEQELTTYTMDVFLESMDIVKILVEKVESGDQEEYPLGEILGKLNAIIDAGGDPGADSAAPAAAPAAPVEATVDPLEAMFEAAAAERAAASEKAAAASAEATPVEATPAPVAATPAPVSTSSAESDKPAAKKEVKVEKTIRIDTERLDNVMNLVGELVLERNRLFSIIKNMEERYAEDEDFVHLVGTGGRINLLTTDLQMAVMRTRMQPVSKVFSKFPRMVRDLARTSGKDMELVMVGEDTELDKSVIEEIGDPLVHLIRNSVDHGIEKPEVREANGKPRLGIIKLSAYHEGDQIVIEIADDGKGIDHQMIRTKAVEKGVISASEAPLLSEKEALNLIFAPGFSTAEQVTDISGRGVGMDVVKTNITNLNGIVDIESVVGQGSKLILKLPLTVAIIDALMVGTGEEIFAIPLSSVIETLRVNKEDVKTINDKEVISLRDGVLSLVRLSEEFDVPQSEDTDSMYVVVIGLAEKRIGVMVEELFGQEEVVIKPLGDYLANIDGISGATVTGDGKVVLILDINTLIQQQIDAKNLR